MINTKFYKGTDLYSDGSIEDELLEIAKKYAGKDTKNPFQEVLEQDTRWPILYHLSPIRENILDWYEFGKDKTLLEIGSGCGAVSGLFCRKCKKVVAIELSKRRSLINDARNDKYGNLEIMLGNFTDIVLEEKFDYVTLIGVLEYSAGYLGGEQPYLQMLKRVREFLKPGGKLLLAIENKFGLKYFAGAGEDHTGKPYEGIEGYENVYDVETFSKPQLQEMLLEAGYTKMDFYYPMPDYKLPTVIYSDDYLPKMGDLRQVTAVYDRAKLAVFKEESVFDQICRDGQFPYFANSFLVICG